MPPPPPLQAASRPTATRTPVVAGREGVRVRRTVVVLGIDGAGKTTAAAAAVAAERAAGRPAQLLRNPARRRWLSRLTGCFGTRPPPAWADRFESVVRTVNVLVAHARAAGFAGTTVMDRHLACQFVLRDVRGLPRGRFLPWLAGALPRPDAVVLLDDPAAIAHARILARGEDAESLAYLQAARKAYLVAAEAARWHVVDATALPKTVAESVLGHIGAMAGPAGPT